MSALFVSAFVLGIAFCAPPGVVTVETVRRGLVNGYRSALLVQVGSLIGDAFWAGIALIGSALLVKFVILRLILGIFGIVLLLSLATLAMRDAWRNILPQAHPTSRRSDFLVGMALSLSNPFAVVFWLGAGTSAVSALIPDPQFTHFAWFFGAFMLGALAYCFFLAGLVSKVRRLFFANFFRWVNGIGGILLLAFALHFAWRIFQSWSRGLI